MIKLISKSPEQTISIGRKLAPFLRDGDLVALIGMLGAGKTYFTKGIALGLGVSKDRPITSPSFVLGNLYYGRKSALYHFDAYRIDNPGEMLRLGLEEHYMSGGRTVTVLEWADKLLPLLEKEHRAGIIKIRFKVSGAKNRILTLTFTDQVAEAAFKDKLATKAK